MPAMETAALEAALAARFKQALDDAGCPKNKSRTAWVAKTFGVSKTMAARWLKGSSYPRDHERTICQRLNINSEWLRTGNGPKSPDYLTGIGPTPMQIGRIAEELPALPGVYEARLAWQALVHRGTGYITAGYLTADGVDALDKVMRQIAGGGRLTT